ncbi:MAG: type II toxin-antitoxin system prevent-host-death family antitoxin [Actinomycetota bacterium]|nr:type II toxin-antitoxin system prevent-host-death family antitoxin [Actinomycetota bacterium]
MTSQKAHTSISVSELAGQLSSVLDDVEAGTTVTITRRGKPVATLGSAGDSAAARVTEPPMTHEDPVAYATATKDPRRFEPPTPLARLLGTGAMRAVLSVFLQDPAASLYQREIARRADVGLRSAQIALDRLEGLGLIASERNGNRRYYSAVRTDRFEDLRSLMSREMGIAEVIARHLSGLRQPIARALIFGSAASGEDMIGSDIDLLVVGEVSDDALVEPIAAAQRELGREVDVVSYRPDEFAKKRDEGNHFVQSVLAGPRIVVIGGSDDA